MGNNLKRVFVLQQGRLYVWLINGFMCQYVPVLIFWAPHVLSVVFIIVHLLPGAIVCVWLVVSNSGY